MAKLFFRTFLPLLFAIACKRLIAQTDVIMLSHLNVAATALANIPMNFMFIDIAIALGLIPVMSVGFATAKRQGQLKKCYNQFLVFTLLIASATVVFCLTIYPWLIKLFIAEALSHSATIVVLILTLGILPEFFRFTLSLQANILGFSRLCYFSSSLDFLLNIVLNWLLAFHFHLGYIGIYIATVVSSSTCAIVLFTSLIYYFNKQYFFCLLMKPTQFLIERKSQIKNLFLEAIRIIMLRGIFILMVILISHRKLAIYHLATFAICLSIYQALQLTIVAYMRTLSIMLGSLENHHFKSFLKNSVLCGSLFLLIISYLLNHYHDAIAFHLYQINHEFLSWFTIFLRILPIWLIADFMHAIQRGYLFYKDRFMLLTKIDTATSWLIILPIFSIGLIKNSPLVAWCSFPIGILITIFLVETVRIKKIIYIYN